MSEQYPKVKTAVVLGGSEGIGLGCAKALMEDNCNVVILSRSEEKLARAARALKSNKGSLTTFAGNISSEKSLDELFSMVKEKYGGCDILVNNNAGPKPGSMLDLSEQDWIEVFKSHVIPFFRAVKHVLPGMRERQWGRIVTIGSISVKEPIENLDLSNFIRSGLASVNKTLAKEIAADNICSHIVCPGSVMTNRSKKLIESRAEKMQISFEESMQITENKIPMGRLGAPGEIGNLVSFLCSDKASYMTGNVIQIDGGMTKGAL